MEKYKIYKVSGMHCASCASIIERTISKVDGVDSVEVNAGTENAKITFDQNKTNSEIFNDKLGPLGYKLIIENTNNKFVYLNKLKANLYIGIPLAIISIIMMVLTIAMNEMPKILNIVMFAIATYTLFFIGRPYLQGFYRFVRTGNANMDTLIGIGTGTAYIYSAIVTIFAKNLAPYLNINHNYFDVTVVVIVFITLGKYLETKSKLKTGDAIEKLLNLQAKTALVIRSGAELEIPIGEVVHGDLIIIKPGSKIPVDGIVTDGHSYIDESMITGEPMPVEINIDSKVTAGTINTTGSFTFRATKIGSETLLAHIIKMVEEAQNSKAPIQALADKISSVFVPVVLGIAFVTLLAWLIIGTNYYGFSLALSYGLTSFVGVLVIACPCALGLATPTAIIVGVGLGAKNGILIKDASVLEKLNKVNILVVDKTGTITVGKPEVTNVSLAGKEPSFGTSLRTVLEEPEKRLIQILASLENKSEHPIAHAIINYVKQKEIKLHDVSNFEIIKGKGLKGTIDGVEYYAGNTKIIEDLNLKFDISDFEKETKEGKTPVILATKNEVLGFVLVADKIKDTAIEAVTNLHKQNIKVVMLTGDNKNTADYIANLVGIDEVVAGALPEDKLNKIIELQEQGFVVAMAGDGVNDAPALARADVGIAMGTGTDVAIESAGITLLSGDISKITQAIKLSHITMRGIKQNLFFAFIYNIIGIPIASGLFFPIFGWLLSPIFAGLAMAMSSVSVVSNSLRIKSKKL